MPSSDSSENEVVALRKLAEDTAASRRESLTTTHLLAAIAMRVSTASELLRERRLDAETLVRMARASTENERDPISHALRKAGEVARTSGAREPAAIHLLIALLNQRKSGAFRALEQCGVDVARFRTAAVLVASGSVEPRRRTAFDMRTADIASSSREAMLSGKRPATRPQPSGVVVPLLPLVGQPLAPALGRGCVPTRVESRSARGEDAPANQEPVVGLPKRLDAPAVRQKLVPRKRTPRAAQPALPHIDPVLSFELDPRSFPVLSSVGVNLTLAAARHELELVVGRETEIEQTLDVLARRRANNPCLVGLVGVGKTAVVRGLAQHIASGKDTRSLDYRVLIELPWTKLLASSPARTALPERFAAISKEVQGSPVKVVLFLDDLHQLLSTEAASELGGELRSALEKGSLPLVSTATPDEYRRFAESDPELARCFSPIEIDEPSQEQATAMLRTAAAGLENHHGVAIPEDAVTQAVAWSVRYLPGRALPDKALSILDLACARSRRRRRADVTSPTVAEVIAEMADVPIERLLETDRDRMLSLETLLASRVVGHEDALRRIAVILRRNAAGLKGQRPIGSFLLLGPTGVGKTETAKAIAEALFHSAEAMTRLDLSEFAESHSLARLIGSPPGYVGHEAGGQLTEALRRRPYQVILLDEIEKAHRDVVEAFLHVLDEGRMTDGRGRTVDMTNAVIVMTSNLGSAEAAAAAQTRSIGFSRKTVRNADIEAVVVAAAREALPPEFYNRIDEMIAFAPLDRANVREIASRLLDALSRQLQQARKVGMSFDDQVIDVLLDQGGFDPILGARPMKRTIARLVEAPIADLILREQVTVGSTIRLRSDGDAKLTLSVVRGS